MASPPPPPPPAPAVQEKTVTGYPAEPSHIAAGHPAEPRQIPVITVHPSAVHPYPSRHASRPRPRHRHRRRHLCGTITASIGVMCTLAIGGFITWSLLEPVAPEFGVDSASLAPLAINQTELSATWDITLFVTNTNPKFSAHYDRLEAWIVYGDDYLISGTHLSGFSQEKQNITLVTVRLFVVSEKVDGKVLGAISRDRDGGSIIFEFRVLGLVKFRNGKWRTRRTSIKVWCENLRFGFQLGDDGTGSLMAGSTECKVRM